MWKRLFAVGLLVPAWAVVAGCIDDRAAKDRYPPPAPASIPASSTAPAANPDSDKDKPRGNTPPGTDRAGGGPADGAIRDPSGAVTKQPDPK